VSCNSSGGLSPSSHGCDPRPVYVDLWWTKWYWNRIYSKNFDLPLSLSFDLSSIPSHSSITDAILATDSVVKIHFEKGTFKVTDIRKCS